METKECEKQSSEQSNAEHGKKSLIYMDEVNAGVETKLKPKI